MKFFGIILLLAVASCQGDIDAESSQLSTRSALHDLVEQAREIMISGHEELGIPVLEPFERDEFDIDFENDSTNLKATLTNLKVTGLAGFEAGTLSFTVIGVRFTYCFNWPELELTSGYSVDGTVVNVIPIYGTGNLDVKVKNVNVCGVLGLSVRGGYLFVRTSTVDFSIGDFELKITGLLDNEEASALISDVITDMVPQVVTDFQEQINGALSDVVVKYGDQILGTMTLSELIALVTGRTR